MDPNKKPSILARVVFVLLALLLAYGLYHFVIWLMTTAFRRGGIPIP